MVRTLRGRSALGPVSPVPVPPGPVRLCGVLCGLFAEHSCASQTCSARAPPADPGESSGKYCILCARHDSSFWSPSPPWGSEAPEKREHPWGTRVRRCLLSQACGREHGSGHFSDRGPCSAGCAAGPGGPLSPRRLVLSCRWPCPRPFSPPPGCDWRWDGSARPRPVCSLGLWVLAAQADGWFSWLATGPSLVSPSRHHTQNRKESPELCPRPRLRVGLVLMDTHLPDMGLWSISVRNFLIVLRES